MHSIGSPNKIHREENQCHSHSSDACEQSEKGHSPEVSSRDRGKGWECCQCLALGRDTSQSSESFSAKRKMILMVKHQEN